MFRKGVKKLEWRLDEPSFIVFKAYQSDFFLLPAEPVGDSSSLPIGAKDDSVTTPRHRASLCLNKPIKSEAKNIFCTEEVPFFVCFFAEMQSSSAKKKLPLLQHLPKSLQSSVFFAPFFIVVCGFTAKRTLVGSTVLSLTENDSDWAFSRWTSEISDLKRIKLRSTLLLTFFPAKLHGAMVLNSPAPVYAVLYCGPVLDTTPI